MALLLLIPSSKQPVHCSYFMMFRGFYNVILLTKASCFCESIVKQGMLHSRGKLLLMLDADGAPKVDDVAKFEKQVGISSGSEKSYCSFKDYSTLLVDDGGNAVASEKRFD
nr:dolichyl-phosphate beta-glucosyltransferase [Tanacetum cinerariifolium]